MTVDAVVSTDEGLAYQGRKASRAKSEQRRRLILEAALRIIVRDGVRGIRHRAVAKEAGVPLAATTYYFKDIDELIVDTFTLYTEKALGVVNEFANQFYQPVSGFAKVDLNNVASQEGLIHFLVEHISAYMRQQVIVQREMLIIEQAFRYEAIVSDRIRILAKLHRSALLERAEVFFRQVAKSKNPPADAEVLLGLLHSLEYSTLLHSNDDQNMEVIGHTIRHYLTLLLPSIR